MKYICEEEFIRGEQEQELEFKVPNTLKGTSFKAFRAWGQVLNWLSLYQKEWPHPQLPSALESLKDPFLVLFYFNYTLLLRSIYYCYTDDTQFYLPATPGSDYSLKNLFKWF